MYNLSNRPQNKNFGDRAGRAAGIAKHEQHKNKYYLSPKYCKHCNTIILYEKKTNNFCNKSCAASYNNLNVPRRTGPPPKHKPKFSRVLFKLCLTCNTAFRVVGGRRTYCSKNCNPLSKDATHYRIMCKFVLNKNDHPTLYDSNLINTYGWYNSTNRPGLTNLTGVSWDHLYRISDGFENSIPPEIMSHPANAELVPWKINTGRKQSQISLSTLYDRIKLWDSGQHNLPRYLTQCFGELNPGPQHCKCCALPTELKPQN